jgi:hypothetical protein
MLPDWDGAGAPNGRLPEWAEELSRACPRYVFSSTTVWNGRAVVAVLTGAGSGPLLVITRDEDEMRAALGLKPRRTQRPGSSQDPAPSPAKP